MEIERLKAEIEQELHEHILPFWAGLVDYTDGGFIGQVDFDLTRRPEAKKGGVVTTRFLWTFAAAARLTGREDYRRLADHSWDFLSTRFVDPVHGGIYWMLDHKGKPVDPSKHIYLQAFAIYAASEYVRATGSAEALHFAKQLFSQLETVGFDWESGAYREQFTRDWQPLANDKLSENGVTADITMNTHLHVLEAYTNLLRVWPNAQLRGRLLHLVELFRNRMYRADTRSYHVFMNRKWEPLLDLVSFGHDIEASWLIDEAIKVLGTELGQAECEQTEQQTPIQYEQELQQQELDALMQQLVLDVARQSSILLLTDGSLPNEREGAHTDYTRVWWVQAEAAVGFLNAYERSGEPHFLTCTQRVWNYIKQHIIDPRPGGEWYWSVEPDGKPTERPVVDPWKANYHNGRFCMEMIERLERLERLETLERLGGHRT